jgi:hypothetical protein
LEELVSSSLPFKALSASEASHEIISSSLPLEGLTSSEESDENVLGRLPVEGCSASNAIQDKILDGWRPDLPVELPSYLRSIIMSCWQSDPIKRPNFSDICKILKIKQGCNPTSVVIDNESNGTATIIKVEQTCDLQRIPLHETLERLLQLHLCASKFEILHLRTATGMVVQQFEVTDDEGRKVCDENCIANIVKVLNGSLEDRLI